MAPGAIGLPQLRCRAKETSSTGRIQLLMPYRCGVFPRRNRHTRLVTMGQTMLNRMPVLYLLGVSALACSAAIALPAQAAPSFGDCAKQIERRGYEIYDMDATANGYDIDAIKGGRRWDLKLDRNCTILKEELD